MRRGRGEDPETAVSCLLDHSCTGCGALRATVLFTSNTHWDCLYRVCRCVCVFYVSFWLQLNRTEALSVTDKRQAPSAKSTWQQASFILADAESITKTLAGGQGLSLPPLHSLFPQLSSKSSNRPHLLESHCSH